MIKKETKVKFNIMAIICILIFSVGVTPITFQNDTFYSIKIGEHIINNGIDFLDAFSWHNLTYTYPHWLYDVMMYGIYCIKGFDAIYISTIIFAAILGIILYVTNTKLSKNNLVSFLLTIADMCVLRGYITARAQLVTFSLFALTIYFIEQFLDKDNGKKYGIGLIIISTIIANLHVAVWPFFFILFLPYIAEGIINTIEEKELFYVMAKKRNKKKLEKYKNKKVSTQKIEKIENEIGRIDRLIKFKKEQKNQRESYKIKFGKTDKIKYLIMILIICMFTGLLTPLGTTPYTYLIKTMQGNTVEYINEHLPMVLANEAYAIAILMIFIGLLTFTDVKIRLRDFLMLGGLTILMLYSKRQLSVLEVISIFILNRLICDLLNKYDKTGTEKAMNKIVTKGGQIIVYVFIIACTCYLCSERFGDKYVDEKSYPIEATEFIKEKIDLTTARIYNEYNYGSYLLFNDIPVFIDSRADLYAPEFNGKDDIFIDYINTANIDTDYETIFEKYSITHVITYADSKLNILLTKDNKYKEIYKDDYFVIYQRNK